MSSARFASPSSAILLCVAQSATYLSVSSSTPTNQPHSLTHTCAYGIIARAASKHARHALYMETSAEEFNRHNIARHKFRTALCQPRPSHLPPARASPFLADTLLFASPLSSFFVVPSLNLTVVCLGDAATVPVCQSLLLALIGSIRVKLGSHAALFESCHWRECIRFCMPKWQCQYPCPARLLFCRCAPLLPGRSRLLAPDTISLEQEQ